MPTIIDSLIVKLGMDSSDYDKSSKKVSSALKATGEDAKNTGKKIKAGAKEGAAGFSDMAKEVTKFLAVLGGTAVIKNFIQDTIESSSAIERFSRNLGRSVEDVSAWSNAAEVAGGSAEGLQGTMDMLSKSQTELQLTGQSGLIPYLTALGVSMTDLNGTARPVNDMLLDLSDKFAGMDRRTANNLGQMMGIDPGTMNLLLQGRQSVEAMIARQKELGVVTRQQAESSERFRQQTVLFRQEMNAFGRDLLSNALPMLEKLFGMFDGLGNWMRDNSDFVATFLSILAGGLFLVGVAATPINLTVAAFVSLAAIMAAVYDDYQTWKSGGNAAMPWDYWIPKLEKAYEWLTKVKDKINEFGYNAFTKLFGFIGSGVAAAKGDAAGMQMAYGGGAGTYQKGKGAMPAPATGGDKASAAMAYFQSQGWSKEQAAGLVANIAQESGFRSDASGDGGKAYGIAQWHPDRQAEFQKLFGKNIKGSSFEEQLAFMQHELTRGNEQGAGNRLRGAGSASEAGAIVSRYYERPLARDKEALHRGGLAQQFMGIPGASQAGAASGATASSGSGPSVSTNVGEVKVFTQATDADGIARDIASALDYLSVSQANSGMM